MRGSVGDGAGVDGVAENFGSRRADGPGGHGSLCVHDRSVGRYLDCHPHDTCDGRGERQVVRAGEWVHDGVGASAEYRLVAG